MLGCVIAWCRMDWKGSCSPEMARHKLHTADEVKDAQATETIGRVGLGEESRRPEVGKLRADNFMKAPFFHTFSPCHQEDVPLRELARGLCSQVLLCRLVPSACCRCSAHATLRKLTS